MLLFFAVFLGKAAQEAGTAEFVKSEPAVVSLISVSVVILHGNLIETSKEIRLEVNPKKTSICFFVCQHFKLQISYDTIKYALRSSFVFRNDSRLKIAALFKRFGEAHLNAIDLARNRTRNLGHKRPALYQLANQVDFCFFVSQHFKLQILYGAMKHVLRSSFVYRIDSQLKMAAPFKRFGEVNFLKDQGKLSHVSSEKVFQFRWRNRFKAGYSNECPTSPVDLQPIEYKPVNIVDQRSSRECTLVLASLTREPSSAHMGADGSQLRIAVYGKQTTYVASWRTIRDCRQF
ncbi:hypothetical protein ANN_14307 [Periplaneta americana]|uniref:Uncharacterized protein n=1 Tax=Periplaneta americana TaxID=6978 RepID=A0ABQ8SXD4_PERAM|nr:hypothetical protein ANN_14307 [Periplaneta americana]